ncbi:hypothetical protein CP532_0066 [Ophiocordyceps camponoti-leonardi (nom. inval.)]|nr:hypothetical protein CP532_0066 [Ophiocordyceps camponoti-leonardi (nom. inval.)]
MRSTTFLSLSLAVSVSALDHVALAKSRITELQQSYSIDWEDRPVSSDGKLLDRNTEPNVTVYIERFVDKSYINAGLSDDTFTLSKSTTVINDVTEGSSVSAHCSGGFQLGLSASFQVSRGKSKSKQISNSDGSFKSETWERIETCEAGYACRFETWTYYVYIQGRCQGSPCEIRTPITGPEDKPLTMIVYIPQKMPSGVDAIQKRIEAQLTSEYCIDWSKPPTRDEFTQNAERPFSTYRSPAKLLSNKPHNVTVHARRVPEPMQTSTGSGNTSFHVTRSTITTQSCTKGWSVGAQLSYQVSAALASTLSPSDFIQLSVSEDKSKQETSGGWISDGFSIRSTCKSGHVCAFETWTLYAHVSGICENVWHSPIQRRCEFDVPIFNRAGEPYAYFAMVADGSMDDQYKGMNSVVETTTKVEKEDNKRPTAVGAIGNLCLLDDYEYWGIQEKKYFDFENDKWIDDPTRAAPEKLEYCQDPIPLIPAETGNKCYKDEIWAASLTVPEKEEESQAGNGSTTTPTANGKVVVDDTGRRWCHLDNNGWYNEESDQYWSDEIRNGVARPEGIPKPQGLDKCTGVPKVNGKARVDEQGRLWCPLENGQWYNPKMKLYWSDEIKDGVAKPDAPEPQGLEGCTTVPQVIGKGELDDKNRTWCPLDNGQWYNVETKLYWSDDIRDGVAQPDAPEPQGLEKCNATTAGDTEELLQPVRATGQAEQDEEGQTWCALTNGEWYNKDKDVYFTAGNTMFRDRREDEAKPEDLDRCTATTTPTTENQNQGDGGCETATSVEVTFRLSEATQFGQTVKIVGNTDALGNWNPSAAVALDASEYEHPHKPMWKAAVTLDAGKKIEYKYIKVEQDGRVAWEAGSNRGYEVAVSCDSTAERLDQWQT